MRGPREDLARRREGAEWPRPVGVPDDVAAVLRRSPGLEGRARRVTERVYYPTGVPAAERIHEELELRRTEDDSVTATLVRMLTGLLGWAVILCTGVGVYLLMRGTTWSLLWALVALVITTIIVDRLGI